MPSEKAISEGYRAALRAEFPSYLLVILVLIICSPYFIPLGLWNGFKWLKREVVNG